MSLEANGPNGQTPLTPAFGLSGQTVAGKRAFLNTSIQDSLTLHQKAPSKKVPWQQWFRDPNLFMGVVTSVAALVGVGALLKKNPEAAIKDGKKALERTTEPTVRTSGGGGGGSKRRTQRIGKFVFNTHKNGIITLRQVAPKDPFDAKTTELFDRSTDAREYAVHKPTIDGEDIATDGKRYTIDYLGQHKKFHETGHRWGVSLGRDHDSFMECGIVDRETGKINLEDGRYLISIRSNGEVVIGREQRGADKAVLEHFDNEGTLPPDTMTVSGKQDMYTFEADGFVTDGDGKKRAVMKRVKSSADVTQLLDVPNHSVLNHRGKVFDGDVNEKEFGGLYAGEIRIHNGEIKDFNTQSGQLFGPNGRSRFNVGDAEDTRKLDDAPERVDFATAFAKKQIERVTEKPVQGYKVNFGTLPEGHERLLAFTEQPMELTLSPTQISAFRKALNHPGMEQVINNLEYHPDDMRRMLEALPQRTPDELDAIIRLMNSQTDRNVRPFQAARMAGVVISEPKTMPLFHEMPLAGHTFDSDFSGIKALSDNSKAKMLGKILEQQRNGSGLSLEASLQQLEASPELLRLLASFRDSSSFLEQIVADIPASQKAAERLDLIHQNPVSSRAIHDISPNAKIHRLKQELKAANEAGDMELAKSLETRLNNLKENGHEEHKKEMRLLFGDPDINLDKFYAFAFEKRARRWTDDQIFTAYWLKKNRAPVPAEAHA